MTARSDAKREWSWGDNNIRRVDDEQRWSSASAGAGRTAVATIGVPHEGEALSAELRSSLLATERAYANSGTDGRAGRVSLLIRGEPQATTRSHIAQHSRHRTKRARSRRCPQARRDRHRALRGMQQGAVEGRRAGGDGRGARGIDDKAADPTPSSLAMARPCADDERGGRVRCAVGGTAQLSVLGHGLTKDAARADASGAMCAPAMRARASAARNAAAAKHDKGMATKRGDGRACAERSDSGRHHRASRRVAYTHSGAGVGRVLRGGLSADDAHTNL